MQRVRSFTRIEAILDELQKDEWLSRQISGQPKLVEQLKAVRQVVETMKSKPDKLDWRGERTEQIQNIQSFNFFRSRIKPGD